MSDLPTDFPSNDRGKDKLDRNLKKIAELHLLKEFEKSYLNPELQKIASVVFQKWPSLHRRMDWEDIHFEGCVELTLTEYWEKTGQIKRKKDKPFVPNRKALYYRICFGICYRKHHGGGDTDPIDAGGEGPSDPDGSLDPVELLLMSASGKETYTWELLVTMLYQCGMPHGLLLFLFYLAQPRITDKEKLFRIALFFGAKLKSARHIGAYMHECRIKFREFAIKHPNFNDLFS